MPAFTKELFVAAGREREVTLVTKGRASGKLRAVTIWISTDGAHLYIRSGEGMKRQWRNDLNLAHILLGSEGTLGVIVEATLRMAGKSIKVKPRHVTDPDEARATSRIAREKYGSFIKPSQPGEPLTKGEQAVFELLPG